jgi:hypothetical protein
VLDGTLTRLRLVFCFAIFCFPSPPWWKRPKSRGRIHFSTSRGARYEYVCCTFSRVLWLFERKLVRRCKSPKSCSPFLGLITFLAMAAIHGRCRTGRRLFHVDTNVRLMVSVGPASTATARFLNACFSDIDSDLLDGEDIPQIVVSIPSRLSSSSDQNRI